MVDHDHDHDDGDRIEPVDAATVLRQAARRVVRRLIRESEGAEGAGRNGPDEYLLHDAESFREAVERVLRGEKPDHAVVDLPPTAVPLVSLVRGEILDDREHSASAVLTAARAVEELGRAWRTGGPEDSDADLRDWLARPDALELVVELAHDLRSPLTSIIFLSETIQRAGGGDLTEVQRRQLGLIYIAALGLSSVVTDVVELASEERDLVDVREASDFWVGEVLDEVATLVRPIAEEKGLELRLDYRTDERWHGLPSALSRILLNLATNALKFTETGWVEIGMRRIGPSEAEFYVLDTGRGIPERDLAELFVPFRSRRRDRSHYFSVSGLGLSICRRYLHAMGSKLEVETELGKGTRFHFRLETPLGR